MIDEVESTEHAGGNKHGKGTTWLGKIITLSFVGVVVLVVVKAQEGKKNDFFEQQHQKSVAWCDGDAHCASAAESHWKHCVEDTYQSQRSSRYDRSYSIDDKLFRDCLMASGVGPLAMR